MLKQAFFLGLAILTMSFAGNCSERSGKRRLTAIPDQTALKYVATIVLRLIIAMITIGLLMATPPHILLRAMPTHRLLSVVPTIAVATN